MHTFSLKPLHLPVMPPFALTLGCRFEGLTEQTTREEIVCRNITTEEMRSGKFKTNDGMYVIHAGIPDRIELATYLHFRRLPFIRFRLNIVTQQRRVTDEEVLHYLNTRELPRL